MLGLVKKNIYLMRAFIIGYIVINIIFFLFAVLMNSIPGMEQILSMFPSLMVLVPFCMASLCTDIIARDRECMFDVYQQTLPVSNRGRSASMILSLIFLLGVSLVLQLAEFLILDVTGMYDVGFGIVKIVILAYLAVVVISSVNLAVNMAVSNANIAYIVTFLLMLGAVAPIVLSIPDTKDNEEKMRYMNELIEKVTGNPLVIVVAIIIAAAAAIASVFISAEFEKNRKS